jgi:hypothetical protein
MRKKRPGLEDARLSCDVCVLWRCVFFLSDLLRQPSPSNVLSNMGCASSVDLSRPPAVVQIPAHFSWCSNPPEPEGQLDDAKNLITATSTEVHFTAWAVDADLLLLAHRCKQLKMLSLHCCKQITDGGLKHIAELKEMRSLNLGSCAQITDAGLARGEQRLLQPVQVEEDAALLYR